MVVEHIKGGRVTISLKFDAQAAGLLAWGAGSKKYFTGADRVSMLARSAEYEAAGCYS